MITPDVNSFAFKVTSRSRRRILVLFFWALIAVLFVLLSWDMGGKINIWFLLILIQIPAICGAVRRGGLIHPAQKQKRCHVDYLPLRPGEVLDEREERERDWIHYRALNWCRWLSLASFVVFVILGLVSPAAQLRLGLSLFYLMMITLWSLPQTMILWTEPDLDPEAEPEIVKEKCT
jgi:hypothetical protein